jgi:hypothetical protein
VALLKMVPRTSSSCAPHFQYGRLPRLPVPLASVRHPPGLIHGSTAWSTADAELTLPAPHETASCLLPSGSLLWEQAADAHAAHPPGRTLPEALGTPVAGGDRLSNRGIDIDPERTPLFTFAAQGGSETGLEVVAVRASRAFPRWRNGSSRPRWSRSQASA